MKDKDEGYFHYESGTRLYVRLWEDEKRLEAPVVLVNVERDYSTTANRTDIARDMATTLGTTPDKITWYEQNQDASLRKYEFRPFQAEFRPYANDMSLQAYSAAERDGDRRPEVHVQYETRESAVTPQEKEALQAKLADRLETPVQIRNREFAEKQNREFDHLNFRFNP